jgi:hypothetical protein
VPAAPRPWASPTSGAVVAPHRFQDPGGDAFGNLVDLPHHIHGPAHPLARCGRDGLIIGTMLDDGNRFGSPSPLAETVIRVANVGMVGRIKASMPVAAKSRS